MSISTVQQVLPRSRILAAVLLTCLVAMSVARPAPAAANDDRTATATYAEQLIVAGQESLRRDPSQTGGTALAELVWSSDLADLARAAADRMAGEQVLAHDPRIRESLCCGAAFADNAGRWPVGGASPAEVRATVGNLVAAWAGSAGHRANLLDRRFTHVGVGVTVRDGQLWASVVFHDRSDLSGELAATSPRPRGLDELCPATDATESTHFRDVEGRHAQAVDCLTDLGIVQGVTDDHFEPAATLTRSQLALLVDRGLAVAGVAPDARLHGAFRDVSSGSTAGAAVERLAAAGLVLGRSDGTFGPHREVTRGQLAAQLDGAIRSVEGEPPTAARGYFRDVPTELRFARAIDVTAELGLLAGDEAGRFNPDQPLRRDHAAAVIARLLDLLQERR